LVTKFLRHLGYQLLEATDGVQALELASSSAVDLILLDLGLPALDGYQVARRLKSDPATADIPLVALTAYALRSDQDRATKAGCDYYLAKPFELDVLGALIEQALGSRACR
jgi:CheY-like chemotaxis protein